MPKRLIVRADGTQELVDYDRPVRTQAEREADEAAVAAEATEEAEIADDIDVIKADQAVRQLIRARPQQIENYIANNVNNLAQAKEVLTILAKAVSMIGRSEFVNRG